MFTEAAPHAARQSACSLSQQLEIDLVAPRDADVMIGAALQAVNALQSVVDRLGVRAASGGAAKRGGFVSDAEWFGQKTQQNASRAARRLKTARLLLRADDDVVQPWVSGKWTPEQSDFIADALVEAPAPPTSPPPSSGKPTDSRAAAEAAAKRKREEAARREQQAALIRAAEEKKLDELRRKAAGAAAARKNSLGRGRKARNFWTRKEEDGLRGGFFLADGEAGLLYSLLEAAQPQILEKHKALARDTGLPINWDHVRADTFVAVFGSASGVSADSGGSKRTSLVTYNVDVRVDESGDVAWPETWMMNGSVPMPAAVADSLASDPILRYLFSVNGKLVGVGQDTPDIPSWVRKAVNARSGGICERPSCSTPGRDLHHQQPRDRGGMGTDPENIIELCWFDHQQITYDGFDLIGPPGDLYWLGPDDPVPEKFKTWVAAFEARCTKPATRFKTREFRPGEKLRRERYQNAQRQKMRDGRSFLDEDAGFHEGGSRAPNVGGGNGGRDPIAKSDRQESFF